MAGASVLTPSVAMTVEQACLSFAAQKIARAIGRQYDSALRPSGLSNWQFTLLVMLVRDEPPTISGLAHNLAMDRTTITANLKPLERRGLLAIQGDTEDRRIRRVVLTDEGHACLSQAYPLWEQAQVACAERLGEVDQTTFRAAASALSR